MQITLSTEQSQVLESLSQQGGYPSMADAIDMALVLLAEVVMEQSATEDWE
jgi:Arc/MetJ-type ribon-helix-helix transcriptional regulator